MLDNITIYVIFDIEMTGNRMQQFRQNSGWNQARLAARLGVAQAYVSMMEREDVRCRIAWRGGAICFSCRPRFCRCPDKGAGQTGRRGLDCRESRPVGISWFQVFVQARTKTASCRASSPGIGPPAARTEASEALAWLLLQFEDLDAAWLVGEAESPDLQNRLGFTVSLARNVAHHSPEFGHRSRSLKALEEKLKPSRLANEGTFGGGEMSQGMPAWVRKNR